MHTILEASQQHEGETPRNWSDGEEVALTISKEAPPEQMKLERWGRGCCYNQQKAPQSKYRRCARRRKKPSNEGAAPKRRLPHLAQVHSKNPTTTTSTRQRIIDNSMQLFSYFPIRMAQFKQVFMGGSGTCGSRHL